MLFVQFFNFSISFLQIGREEMKSVVVVVGKPTVKLAVRRKTETTRVSLIAVETTGFSMGILLSQNRHRYLSGFRVF